MQILSLVSGVEALLVYFCAILYRRTLSGESGLMPGVENQLVSGLIHKAISSGLFHQGDWEQKERQQIPAYVSEPCHIHYLYLLPTPVSLAIWIHHCLILKYFFRFALICAISFPHQPRQTIRLVKHAFCVWHWHEIIDSYFKGVLGHDEKAVNGCWVTGVQSQTETGFHLQQRYRRNYVKW